MSTRRKPDPAAAPMWAALVADLAAGRGVDANRVVLVLALNGKSIDQLQAAVDAAVATRTPRRIAASARTK